MNKTMKTKVRKIGTQDLRDIPPGEVRRYYVPTPIDIETVQSLSYRLNRIDCHRGIRYSTTANYDELYIEVTANIVKVK